MYFQHAMLPLILREIRTTKQVFRSMEVHGKQLDYVHRKPLVVETGFVNFREIAASLTSSKTH